MYDFALLDLFKSLKVQNELLKQRILMLECKSVCLQDVILKNTDIQL